MENLLSSDQLSELQNSIDRSHNIVVCGHRGPDGDAVGSTLGWTSYLQSLGKQVTIVLPDAFPDFLQWMPNSASILIYDQDKEVATSIINEAHLIFCLDFNNLGRMREMGTVIKAAKADRILIDHHEKPVLEDFPKQVISFPEFCATCEIVTRLIHQLGGFDELSKDAATCLYTGMMTDTIGFTFNSNRLPIYAAMYLLLTKGFDKDEVYRKVFNSYSADRLRLMGYILNKNVKYYADNKASIYTLSEEEKELYNFQDGDAEGLVNMPLQVKGMRLSISLREDRAKGEVSVSLRSVPGFPCDEMSKEFFGGGGHKNAAGAKLKVSLHEAEQKAINAIEAYQKRGLL